MYPESPNFFFRSFDLYIFSLIETLFIFLSYNQKIGIMTFEELLCESSPPEYIPSSVSGRLLASPGEWRVGTPHSVRWTSTLPTTGTNNTKEKSPEVGIGLLFHQTNKILYPLERSLQFPSLHIFSTLTASKKYL